MTASERPGGATPTLVAVPRTNHYLLAVATAGLLLVTALSPRVLTPSRADEAASGLSAGGVTVHQVSRTSVVIETPHGVVYSDPTGGGARYAGLPTPDVVLVSRSHPAHYDAATLAQVVGPHTRLVVPAHVERRLPQALSDRAAPLAGGERAEHGPIAVTRQHGAGGRGYVATMGEHRFYVAGSTVDPSVVLHVDDDQLVLEAR